MFLQYLTLSFLSAATALLLCLAAGVEPEVTARLTLLLAALPLPFCIWQEWLMVYHRQIRMYETRIYPELPALPAGFAPEPPAEKHVRLIAVRGPGSTVFASDRAAEVVTRTLLDGADEADLAAFVDGLATHQLARRSWIGLKLPSGRTVDPEYYDRLIAPLVKVGAVVGRREKVSGTIVMGPPEIKRRLGLVF
jgi:hypothetical protein